MTENNNNNKENTKKFEENDLEKVDGGYAPACNSAEYELNNAIAQEERTRIADKSSIDEFRKQLAENGIDVVFNFCPLPSNDKALVNAPLNNPAVFSCGVHQ